MVNVIKWKISIRKQSKVPNVLYVYKCKPTTSQELHRLNNLEFKKFCTRILKRNLAVYEDKLDKKSGYDLRCYGFQGIIYVKCLNFKEGDIVDKSDLISFCNTMVKDNVTNGYVMTNVDFHYEAIEFIQIMNERLNIIRLGSNDLISIFNSNIQSNVNV
jgi:hypothetical protein